MEKSSDILWFGLRKKNVYKKIFFEKFQREIRNFIEIFRKIIDLENSKTTKKPLKY